MRAIATVLIFAILATATGSAQQHEAVAWRQVAEAIPLGSKVKIQTTENKRVNGTLMRVDGTSVLVKRNTRHPEPAVAVTFDTIARLEHDKGGGMNIGKAMAIGFATGAGVIVTMILFALQFD
jgi:hypothetical protein